MSKRIFVLSHAVARDNAANWCQDAPQGQVVTFSDPTRTTDQNSALWPLLDEISAQVDWHGMKLSSVEWKDAFTATLKGQKAIPNLTGTGFIIVGTSSSKMSKKDFSDLLELASAFAAEHGVKNGN